MVENQPNSNLEALRISAGSNHTVLVSLSIEQLREVFQYTHRRLEKKLNRKREQMKRARERSKA